MNSYDDEKRIETLTAGPVLATLERCRARIEHASLWDRWLLCRHFGVDVGLSRMEAKRLVRKLHTAAREKGEHGT